MWFQVDCEFDWRTSGALDDVLEMAVVSVAVNGCRAEELQKGSPSLEIGGSCELEMAVDRWP